MLAKNKDSSLLKNAINFGQEVVELISRDMVQTLIHRHQVDTPRRDDAELVRGVVLHVVIANLLPHRLH